MNNELNIIKCFSSCLDRGLTSRPGPPGPPGLPGQPGSTYSDITALIESKDCIYDPVVCNTNICLQLNAADLYSFLFCCSNLTFESYLLLKGQDLEQVFKVLQAPQEDRAYLVKLVPQEPQALQAQDTDLKTFKPTYKVSFSFLLLMAL